MFNTKTYSTKITKFQGKRKKYFRYLDKKKKKQVINKGNKIRLLSDFLTTFNARRKWSNIFKIWKGRTYEAMILQLVILTFKGYKLLST